MTSQQRQPIITTVDLKVLGQHSDSITLAYDTRDIILYALGIGCEVKRGESHFLAETDPKFATFATFPLMLLFKCEPSDVRPYLCPSLALPAQAVPAWCRCKTIHVFQSLSLRQPLSVSGGAVTALCEVIGAQPKAAGVLILTTTTLLEAVSGAVIAVSTQGIYIPGLRLAGGAAIGETLPRESPLPDRAPDHIDILEVSDEQALLYRLSGDYNPLHCDPKAAIAQGLDKPILHGLCTLGFIARSIIRKYGEGVGSSLKEFTSRFTKPVYPGDTLQVHIWLSPSPHSASTISAGLKQLAFKVLATSKNAHESRIVAVGTAAVMDLSTPVSHL